ncbi:hypothetical protein BU25DRAFT_442352 [Macroventuria anomochaeta]|uniref:Uncharacterized protein n=1 Tax=Macroventuria anomochaeta TaxID=301207 RepID=A0ACB6RSJ3_9PLEO|nr:uncharacterized protein BU25DRAFT_442352 [Macroventuria anomochaeta]KAF2623887.1 hypothetical protein BU25DRAFT_442352 [Macroventuria anomochaeta]
MSMRVPNTIRSRALDRLDISSWTSSITVFVHALSCGHFTLLEPQFVKPSPLEARRTVRCLAPLIQHRDSGVDKLTRILLDLSLRRDLGRYPLPIQKHTENRRPIITEPDIIKNVAKGGLAPDDIDYVIYSHVHWDHVGEPRDFQLSTFVVGHGPLTLLAATSPKFRGGHSVFEPDLLPEERSIELSDPSSDSLRNQDSAVAPGTLNFNAPWRPHGSIPQTIDLFNDDNHQIYPDDDACHDRRFLTGEKETDEWTDAEGHVCCIHANREQAEETIGRIRVLEKESIGVIFAHDFEWEDESRNRSKFFGVE